MAKPTRKALVDIYALRQLIVQTTMTKTSIAYRFGISCRILNELIQEHKIPWLSPRICMNCNRPYRPKKRQQEYCLPRCHQSARAAGWVPPRPALPTAYCAACGAVVQGMTWQRYSMNKTGRFFCCHRCQGEWRTEHFSGENHPLWRGGKCRKGYGTKYWDKQRQCALKRDSHTCQRCGITQEALETPLQVHHKIPSRLFQPVKLAHDLSNLITLCPTCHGIVQQDVSTCKLPSSTPKIIVAPIVR